MNTLGRKSKILLVVLLLCCALLIAFSQGFGNFVKEKIFISRYSDQKDFWLMYPTIQENRELIKNNPNNDSAYYSLGQGLYGLRAYDGAIDALTHATAIAPNADYYWAFLGKVYQVKKDYIKARDAYAKVLELKPDKPLYYTTLAWLYYFRLSEEEYKAYEVLQKGLEKFPTDKDILFDITRFYLYDKNEVEFRKYAKRYLKIDPTSELIKKAYEKGFESVFGSDKPTE